jgi:hypothetical protein
MQALHRVRERLMGARPALVNQQFPLSLQAQ